MNAQDQQQLVTLLQQLEPGFLPLDVFNQIARLTRQTIVNITPIRTSESGIEIGLTLRGADDLWWPNMWHLPGTVLRPTDKMNDAFDRLFFDELQVEKSTAPIFVHFLEHHSLRGAELVLIHTLENGEFPPQSPVQFFPIDNLPDNFVDTEQRIVDTITAHL